MTDADRLADAVRPIDEAADEFVAAWGKIQKLIHDNAKAHGFWEGERNDGEAIALMHSELSWRGGSTFLPERKWRIDTIS